MRRRATRRARRLGTVNYVFWNDNAGFLKLYGAFKDALTVRTGFVKWWTDTRKEFRRKEFTYITAQQIQQILSEDPSAKLVEIGKSGFAAAAAASDAAAASSRYSRHGSVRPSHRRTSAWCAAADDGAARWSSSWHGRAAAWCATNGPAASDGPPPMPPVAIYDHVVIAYEVKKPLVKVDAVPPEEMRLDRYARSFRDSPHRWS